MFLNFTPKGPFFHQEALSDGLRVSGCGLKLVLCLKKRLYSGKKAELKNHVGRSYLRAGAVL